MKQKSISEEEMKSVWRALMMSGLIRITNEFDESFKERSIESFTDALEYYRTIRDEAKSWIPQEVRKYDEEAEKLFKNFRKYKK